MDFWRKKLDEDVIDVLCNDHQRKNCVIKLDGVFCDGYKKGQTIGAFSHFHDDHIAAVADCVGSYDVLITHPITFEGIVALKPGIRHREQWITQDFDTVYKMNNGSMRLLKANHIPGSSQIHVETGDMSLLYSGDFSFPDMQIRQADYLVLDSTHGDPWSDGKTDRKSVKNRLFEHVIEVIKEHNQVLISTSSGTLQEIIRHFEIGYGRKMDADIVFVMDEKQERVLKNIYKSEVKEFRNVIKFDSAEFWKGIRNNRKCVIFTTGQILDESLRSLYKIIIDKYRFSDKRGPIVLFDGGCRYNLSAHASIEEIYSYIEEVNPKWVVTDYSRSDYAKILAKLIQQKFPHIKATYRPREGHSKHRHG